MILMSIDHANIMLGAFQHPSEIWSEPIKEFPDMAPYWIRYITHPCAPGFGVLMGVGIAFFSASRANIGWSLLQISNYFTIRGLILIVIQWLQTLPMIGFTGMITFVLLTWGFNLILGGLLAVLFLYAQKRLSIYLMSKRGVSQVKAENVAYTAAMVALTILSFAFVIQNRVSIYRIYKGESIADYLYGFFLLPVSLPRMFSIYPVLAWSSFTVYGLLLGKYLTKRARQTSHLIAANLGMAAFFALLFVITRLVPDLNTNASILPGTQGNPYFRSVRHFFFIVKYNPEPAYALGMVGVNHFLLAILISLNEVLPKALFVLEDFGRSALFFFLIHFQWFMLLAKILLKTTNYPRIDPSIGALGLEDELRQHGIKLQLGLTLDFWLWWAASMVMLWAICRQWAYFKASRSVNSIWRLF